ncbi:hypothetical protein BT63DRAFT_419436 [Microthyrium microscopicum]|uniref:CHCH domain-containing protein n=1 Tax=Microthyrium microscopicum TaxID=703497 RepID=A0A6A6UT62_9PEZI|nr:hypothetical protein BT63DRAFT_419436 [Microthyrium microscopicum]
MARSRGSAGGSRRPTAAPARSAPAAQQKRPASTTTMPARTNPTQPPATQGQASQGPGLFGQMASTAAGVAVGSSIGHAIGGFFGGGSSVPAEQPVTAAENSSYEQPRACGEQVTQFRSCMDQNQGDLNICGWYLEQLKACQKTASQY